MAKKKSSTSPTARTLQLCRKVGWEAGVVERRLPKCFITVDLFGFVDVVALDGQRFVGIQTTSGDNMASRVTKTLAEPRAMLWLQHGGRIIIHGWVQRLPSKRWECRERELFEADFQNAPTGEDE